MKNFIPAICRILANCEHGYANGYIIINSEHPYYGLDIEDLDHIDIHGYITYSESLKDFLYKHNIEILDDSLNDYWVLGFDTFHFKDNQNNWNKENCIQETLKLKHILEGV